MDEAGLGTLTRRDDRLTLTFTRRLPHSREKVWRAVTEPEHLAVWYPQEIVGDRRAGRLPAGRSTRPARPEPGAGHVHYGRSVKDLWSERTLA